ncbi:hypothetical protein Sjap_012177 [Stephania japonica]|uniref:Uncharacterized protein n=1 Tax=Stephania japonica TaxID=461633 RepID=A0AAP0NYM9_9MAGN
MLMLCDVYFAIRRKARYIPCRLFSFNSFTLTLLAIAAKLPVDLTTNMPSARDQLSKLTGTAMICICIGFMAPSLANSKRGRQSEQASIGLFVVTVIVNMCIEMRTGVIFSFVPEHIIIMCFMIMLLYTLLYNVVEDIDQETTSRWRVEKFDQTDEVAEGENVECAISKIERGDEILFPDDWVATKVYRRVRDFIVKLPICVYREIRECSVFYDCDERARHLTKLLLSNLDPILVDKVQWKFPDGWPVTTSRNFDVPPDSHDTNAQLDGSTEGGARTSHEIGLSAGEIRLANASDNV